MNCTRGGFVSSAENYSQQATNCWSANAVQEKLNSTNNFHMYGFGKERVNSAGTPGTFGLNCYTTASNDPTSLTNAIAETTTKEDLIAGIVTDSSSYVLNNNVKSINDGYPVLAWEDKGIWDGTADTVWDGAGTAESPYLITSAAELYGLAKNIFDAISTTETIPVAKAVDQVDQIYNAYTGKYFKLTTDIDLNNMPWVPIGRYGMRFNGIFDGDGHVVKNISIGTAGTGTYFAQGFFGAIGYDAEIRNLGVENVSIVFKNQDTLKDYNASGDPSLQGGKGSRTNSTGGLVGLCGLSTIENCYAKGVTINNTNNLATAYFAGGLVGSAERVSTDISLNNAKFTCKNCYVKDVSITGNFNTAMGLFVGMNKGTSGDNYRVLYNFENCCVYEDTKPDGNVGFEFAGYYGLNGSGMMKNCYTVAGDRGTNTSFGGFSCYVLTSGATATDIAKALVTGNNAWTLDSVANPINGGYPVLGWEKWWTVDTDPMAFYKGAGVTVADGNVTAVTVIQSDSAVEGEVVVAVYNGTRFESATTATAANGAITLATPLAVDAGDTVKVFVWNSLEGLTPLGVEYSTTIAE